MVLGFRMYESRKGLISCYNTQFYFLNTPNLYNRRMYFWWRSDKVLVLVSC